MNEEEFNKWMDNRTWRKWALLRWFGIACFVYIFILLPIINWLTGYGFGW